MKKMFYVVGIASHYGVEISDLVGKQAAYELVWKEAS